MRASVLYPRSRRVAAGQLPTIDCRLADVMEERDLHCQRFADAPAVASKLKEPKKTPCFNQFAQIVRAITPGGFRGSGSKNVC